MSTTSMTTGWPALDSIEGGFRKGEMTIFYAKPSNIPKTCFTLDLITTHHYTSVLFTNFEGCNTLKACKERLQDHLKE